MFSISWSSVRKCGCTILDEEKNYDIREEKEKSIATSAFTTYYFNMNSFNIGSKIRDEVKKKIQDYYTIPTDIIQALDSN